MDALPPHSDVTTTYFPTTLVRVDGNHNSRNIISAPVPVVVLHRPPKYSFLNGHGRPLSHHRPHSSLCHLICDNASPLEEEPHQEKWETTEVKSIEQHRNFVSPFIHTASCKKLPFPLSISHPFYPVILLPSYPLNLSPSHSCTAPQETPKYTPTCWERHIVPPSTSETLLLVRQVRAYLRP